jgi:AcrR family transcriptional regulator
MKVEKRRKKKEADTVVSSVKNPELALKMQKHIAKKASKLFIKKGYHRTSMRDIAEATGMAVGNIYNYIKKKEDVLSLVFDVFHMAARDYFGKQGLDNVVDPQEKLRTMLCLALKNADDFRDAVIFMYRESWLLPKAHKKKFLEKEQENILRVEKVIKDGIDQGVFHPRDSYYAASMIVYQVSIEPLRGWTFKDRLTRDEVNRMTVDYILKTILK